MVGSKIKAPGSHTTWMINKNGSKPGKEELLERWQGTLNEKAAGSITATDCTSYEKIKKE